MPDNELRILLEAQELVELGVAEWIETARAGVPRTDSRTASRMWRVVPIPAKSQGSFEADSWECPCGREEPAPGARTVPVRTLVSLREPRCPFCRREYEQRIQAA